MLKSFLVSYWEFPKVVQEERLSLGSMLIEFLYPLIMDDFLMEEQFLPLMHDIIMIG